MLDAIQGQRAKGGSAAERVTPLRFVTATSLFDGHDAAINIMRRLLQQAGVEVVHLGHNRSVDEIVTAAVHEDAQGIAVSSYQGGHIEFFKYMVDLLRDRGAGSIRVFGGGGGVISAPEIRELEAYGVERIYAPEDGQRLGLEGMIDDVVARAAAIRRASRRRRWRASKRPTGVCWRGSRPASRTEPRRRRFQRGLARGPVPALSQLSASPAPAAQESRRSPTS